MYGLFNNSDRTNVIELHFAEFDYVRRTYLREIANVVDFYHNRVFAVKSNHFLSHILYHLDVPFQYSPDRYVETARTRSPYLANSVKMTSELSGGQIFNNVFYDQGCKEIIIYEDEYFNPFYAEVNWQRINAVKVLLHPKSDLGLLLPNGKLSSTGSGLAVLSINIPLLALQYRSFMLDQQTKINASESKLGVSHFIHMFVLPNMLYSQIDITIMNRLMNLYYGIPMGEQLLKHPFMVTNYSQRLDSVLKKVLYTLESRTQKFIAVLNQIPAIASIDMLDALQMPDLAETRQVYWALILSRLNIMNFLLDLGKESSLSQNRMEINQIQRTLTRMKNDKAFESKLDGDLLYDVKLLMDKILTA